MPSVPSEDVRTREVLEWKGVHLFYGASSLCSRKVVCVLALKGVQFEGHLLDLRKRENRTDFYVGINPRGLVPCLVHDGEVIIESNDILLHLEKHFKEPALIPSGPEELVRMKAYLDTQDAYHIDIRNLTFKFIIPSFIVARMAHDTLAKMDRVEKECKTPLIAGSGQDQQEQRKFYAMVAEHGNVPDSEILQSIETFRRELAPVDKEYAKSDFLVGGTLSLADIALWVDVERLCEAGYPMHEFPNLLAAYKRLAPAVTQGAPKTVQLPMPVRVYLRIVGPYRAMTNQRLVDVAAGRKPCTWRFWLGLGSLLLAVVLRRFLI